MSSLNDRTFAEIFEALEKDVFPMYLRAIAEDAHQLHQELVKLGSAPEDAFNSTIYGIIHRSFTNAVKLSLVITAASNSTESHEEVITFIKTKFKYKEEFDLRQTLKVIKGGKDQD